MQNIYGNIQGIKSSQIKQLQSLYEQQQPRDRFITLELAQTLATITSEIQHPICCYINRRGQIIRVAVGVPSQTQIPLQELPRHRAESLSKIHCVATQLKSEPPHEAALIAMGHQRLDALVILNVADREVKNVFIAHLVPDLNTPWVILPSLSLVALTEQNFDELVKEWEREIAQAGGTFLSQEIVSNQDKVLLVGMQTDDVSPQRFEDGLAELMRLVESAGGIVLEVVRQKRDRPHPQTVVGKGKLWSLLTRSIA